jgi:hypothetical protein
MLISIVVVSHLLIIVVRDPLVVLGLENLQIEGWIRLVFGTHVARLQNQTYEI